MLSQLIIVILILNYIKADETLCTINGKKSLHRVDERFVSVSIDPAFLLAGLNLSDTSLQMAKHFSPAYVRIAGPSTRFVKYIDDEDAIQLETPENIIVTPSSWFALNEWLALANLTPIFGVNDIETVKGVWNPKSILPLLEISDKLNVSCAFQLGYDCTNKSEMQYKEDLMIFRHILDAFPERRDNWTIVGSDFSKCIDYESATKITDDLQDTIGALMWESNYTDIPLIRPKIPIWTAVAKNEQPISFGSAINWARDMGDAALLGYDVIFRQPRLHEIFSETPAYWVSVLHKSFMGRNVLDVKMTGLNENVHVYAHCTKKQNSFARSGAMTIMMVNNGTRNHTALVRFGALATRSTEVQSYVLTANPDDDTETYLNDAKLSSINVADDRLLFIPKLRRAKTFQHLSLTVPGKSVSFFVLPVARIPICVSDEEEIKLLIEEIHEDQNIPFSEEVSIELLSRNNMRQKPQTLKEMKSMVAKELETDEKYYKKSNRLRNKKKNDNRIKEDTVNNEIRNYLIERARLSEKQRKHLDHEYKKNDLKHLLKEKQMKDEKQHVDLELSSTEIRKILSERAKMRAAKKNIKFNSDELEELMNRATEKLMKNADTTTIKLRSARNKRADDNRNRKDINMKLLNIKTAHKENGQKLKKRLDKLSDRFKPKNRAQRDINMEMLKKKTPKKSAKSNFKNQEVKEATLRAPDQSSEELVSMELSSEENPKNKLPNGEIYAKFATSEEFFAPKTTTSKPLISKLPKFSLDLDGFPKKNPLDDRPKFGLDLDVFSKKYASDDNPFAKFDTKPDYNRKATKIPDRMQTLDDFDDIPLDSDDDFPCIHEYTARKFDIPDANKFGEQLEIGEMISLKLTNMSSSLDTSDYIDLSDDKRRKREVIKKPNKIRKTIKLRKKNKSRRSLYENVGHTFNKRYESLTDGLKIWKPSDILTLKPRKTNDINLKPIDDTRVFRSLKKRYVDMDVDDDVDRVLNVLDDMDVNAIEKDGDYRLIFPNKDAIEISEKPGNIDIKLVNFTGNRTENIANNSSENPIISDQFVGNLLKEMSQLFKDIAKKFWIF